MPTSFPDPRTYEFPEWALLDDYFYYAKDIVSFGNDLSQENLETAYRNGIFPWYMEGVPLPWFCPQRRAILEFARLHIPRSLQKVRRRSPFTITVDKDFTGVIKKCGNVTRGSERGTWITDGFVSAYTALHAAGRAHSVEVWSEAGDLVGGLYGVDAGGVFCGESMFYEEANASKLALLHLVDLLSAKGASWLDVQVMTPHFQAMGAHEITREEFLVKLKETQKLDLKLF